MKNNQLILYAANRLMEWAYKLKSHPSQLPKWENLVLDRVFKLHGRNYSTRESHFASFKARPQDLFEEILPSVFNFQFFKSLGGHLFHQHLSSDSDFKMILSPEVTMDLLPYFAYPMHCVICNQLFPNLNESNWQSRKGQIVCNSSGPCGTEFDRCIDILNKASIGVIEVLKTTKECWTDATEEANQAYKDACNEFLPSIMEGYGVLIHYGDYKPRYQLSRAWKVDPKEYIPINEVVTKENCNPIFEENLIGCWVSPYKKSTVSVIGKPKKVWEGCTSEGDPIPHDGEIVLVSDLKMYLVE